MADVEEDDDFTFPTTTNLPPCHFESPPLWRAPPRLRNDEFEETERFELCTCEACRDRDVNESLWYVDDEIIREEKMDLLWEDLDEKFSRKNINFEKSGEDEDDDDDDRDEKNVKICCVKALKMSKENGNAINGLKASFLELIRFLMKKGFSMHNSGNSIKKIAW